MDWYTDEEATQAIHDCIAALSESTEFNKLYLDHVYRCMVLIKSITKPVGHFNLFYYYKTSLMVAKHQQPTFSLFDWLCSNCFRKSTGELWTDLVVVAKCGLDIPIHQEVSVRKRIAKHYAKEKDFFTKYSKRSAIVQINNFRFPV
jgi:hypothetical protein